MRDERDGRLFMVTDDHLKLARRMFVGWLDCEFGAPEIDPKRPYGNSFVEGDILEILGVDPVAIGNGDADWRQEDYERARKIHREMQDVLQIALVTGRFEAGLYRKAQWFNALSWEVARA